MSTKTKKMGFLSVLSLVIGAQVGSGALNMPAIFAPCGYTALYTWILATIGALSLAYIFSQLVFHMPKTGGPHIYITEVFGKKIGFFAGWLYWVVSWTSTAVVLIVAMSYLNQVLQIKNSILVTVVGLFIWGAANYVNLKGVQFASSIEIFLTTLKILFFAFFIGLGAICFDSDYLTCTSQATLSSIQTGLIAAMWCFLGIEVATTPAESVQNPKRTIPRAVIIGTAIVGLIYIFSTMGCMSVIEKSVLANSSAPYSVVASKFFGNMGGMGLSIMAFLLCLGSMNAWILASGQIALGLAKDKFLPSIFGKTRNDTPITAILISALGVSIIWILGSSFNLLEQLIFLIDSTVPGFIVIYLLCAIAFLKFAKSFIQYTLGLVSISFCILLLATSTMTSWIIIAATCLLAVPVKRFIKNVDY